MVSFSATCSALCNCTCSSPMKLLFLAHKNAFRLTYNFVLLPWWFFSESKLLKKLFNFSFLSLCFPSVKNIFNLYVLFNSRQVHCFQ